MPGRMIMNGITYLMNNGNLTAEGVVLLFLMFWIFKIMGVDKLFRWGTLPSGDCPDDQRNNRCGDSPVKGQSPIWGRNRWEQIGAHPLQAGTGFTFWI